MKTRYILYIGALAALLSGCAKETAVVSAEGSKADDGVLYSFTATASDPMTRSFFKEEEAPSRYIYWEDTDEFDFHDITIGESKESVSVTSAKPTSMGASKKSVLFEKKGHDYMVISYPKGAVTLLDSTFITTYVPNRYRRLPIRSPTMRPSRFPFLKCRHCPQSLLRPICLWYLPDLPFPTRPKN